MNASSVFSWLNVPAWQGLVQALLHTLWQGALLAGGLGLILRGVPARRANLRYGLCVAALVALVLAGVASWALLAAPEPGQANVLHRQHPTAGAVGKREPEDLIPAATGGLLTVTQMSPGARTGGGGPVMRGPAASKVVGWVPWTAAAWLLGVGVSLLRAARGTWEAGRLRRRCQELVDPQMLALAEELRSRLRVSQRVRFLVCGEIDVPAVLGVLYPAVLLPASLLTGVPSGLLRAVLAHELAHIRRWDYLVNLGQMLVEACLFFNPFVWWISRQMRLEREACCDQLAAGECPSTASYVEALVAVIERHRHVAAGSSPILAASGSGAGGDGALERARRLLVADYQPVFRVRWFSLAATLVSFGLVLGGLWLGGRAVAQTLQAAGEKADAKPAGGPKPSATVAGVPDDVLAAAREGDGKRAVDLLRAADKAGQPFNEESVARMLDSLVRAGELRAWTTLYDALRHFSAENWQPSDELLADLARDRRTDFFDALLTRRFEAARLSKAAESADPATAALLARRIAEVGRAQGDVEALCLAAADNDLSALRRLVDAGTDVNAVGKDDNTPLIRAVFKNRLEAAGWLLDHGAQVDKPRLPGWNYTPLCLVNSVPMAQLLKDHGANVRAKLYERDVSILTYVVDWAPADVVAWFLKQGADATAMGDRHENLLFGLKDGATAEALLEAGADPNVLNDVGYQTPLSSAQSVAVARALIRHGADLKPKLTDGATLLEQAVHRIRREDDTPEEDAALIEELIKQGAEFDPKGNGVTAMVRAAFLDHVGEVRAFLDHGVSPDAVDYHDRSEPRSALSSAAYQGPRALKLLLERGANPNAPLVEGQLSPLSTALAGGKFECADLLRQAGATGVTDLAYYTVKGDEAKVAELLAQHADPNETDVSGWTPLRYAVQHSKVGVAKMLLDHGANVDQFDKWGFTPYVSFRLYKNMIEGNSAQAKLQWHLSLPEAEARLAAMQQLFMQYPPNPAYRNAAGRTALHQAIWNGSFVVGTMLEKHASRFDPNLPDKEGRAPLLLAALSPTARDTKEKITTTEKAKAPREKTWNQQALNAHELLQAGARLDLPGPGGRPVGELALAAAREANNAQLVGVLTDAMQTQAAPAGGSPAPGPAASASPADPAAPDAAKQEAAAPPADPPTDLANLGLYERDEIWTSAYAAIKAGDIKTIEGFLQRGLDVNANLSGSSSLLFLAVDENQLAIVKLLLAHGADVRAKTSWGDVPLQRACWRGFKEVADTLLQAGAPPNEIWYDSGLGDVPALKARDQRQPLTPKEAREGLSFALTSGHPNTFEFLWTKLAPMDDAAKGQLLQDMYEAVGEWGHPNLLPTLEALGATPARGGEKALAVAASRNYVETVRALLERGVSPNRDSKHEILRNVAGEGHLEVVRLLLDHGANINAQDSEGLTPLAWAGYNGHEAVCLLLLERGADGSIKDRDGRNAAWHAVGSSHCPEALARMIKAGVPVSGLDERGGTILDNLTHFSTPGARKGTFFMKVYSPADVERFNERERRTVELLLAAGVDPNSGKIGILAEAMYSNHYEAARVLLAHGADPARKDQNGYDALTCLIAYVPDGPMPLDLFKTLLERSGSVNPPGLNYAGKKTSLLDSIVAYAPRNGQRNASFVETVKIMLDGGATFAGVADPGGQALLQAAARGDLAAVQRSVRQGVSVNAASEDGWDALSIVTALGYKDCADWLLANGAEANSHLRVARYGLLVFAIQQGWIDVVEVLLGKGAKITDSYEVLYWALDQKTPQICEVLLKAGADPKAKTSSTVRFGDGPPVTTHGSVLLYRCIERGWVDVARTLLDGGAEAEPPNLDQNENLAYWAVVLEQPEILQSLLDHGANPLLKGKQRPSALDLARESHPKMVPMLEKAAARRKSD